MARPIGIVTAACVFFAGIAQAGANESHLVGSLAKGALQVYAPADVGSFTCWTEPPITLDDQRTLYFFSLEIVPTKDRNYSFDFDFNGPIPQVEPELVIGAALLPVMDEDGNFLGPTGGLLSFDYADPNAIVTDIGVITRVARSGRMTINVHLRDYAPVIVGSNAYPGALYVSVGFATVAAAPVPEPSVFALMASGLCLVGVATARRKRQACLSPFSAEEV